MDASIGTFTEMGFEEAVEATRAEFVDRGFSILHETDLTATLKREIGKDIERVLILGVCRPDFTGAAFDISKDVALLTPGTVVVRESGGGCIITARNPDLLTSVVSGGLRDLTDDLAHQLRSIMERLTR